MPQEVVANPCKILDNRDDIMKTIDDWARLAESTIFYLDTEVAFFSTSNERLSTIQCLTITNNNTPNQSEQQELISSCKVIPPSLASFLLSKLATDKNNTTQNLWTELESTLLDNIVPNVRVVILDVFNHRDCIDYFIQHIMTNERFEKVFHYKTFDLKFLGGSKTRNVSCTFELSSKFTPYHLLPIENCKLVTLADHLAKRLTKEHVSPRLEQLSTLLTYSNKGEMQESNWGQRPLTAEQIEYAAKDVVVLYAVHHLLLHLLVHEEHSFHVQAYIRHLFSGTTNEQTEEEDDEDSPNSSSPMNKILRLCGDGPEDIEELERGIKELSDEYKRIGSIMGSLQERIKQVMVRERIAETDLFKLSVSKRTNVQVSLQQLVEHVNKNAGGSRKGTLNIPIGITATVKKGLKEAGYPDIPNEQLTKQESTINRVTTKY